MKKIFSILFIGVVVVSLMMIPAALVGASPGPGIVGQWHLDGNANDSSGNNLNGAVSLSGASFVSGKFGQALSVDGTGYVQVPDSTLLEPSEITVEAWVKRLGSPGGAKYIVSKYLPNKHGAYSSYGLYTGSGGLRFYIGYSGGWIGSPQASASAVWDGNWHHVAGTFDGSQIKLYLDGVQVDGATSTLQDIYYSGTGGLFIGSYYNGSWLAFSGEIDEVGIWDVALTADDIAALASPTYVPPPSGNEGKDKGSEWVNYGNIRVTWDWDGTGYQYWWEQDRDLNGIYNEGLVEVDYGKYGGTLLKDEGSAPADFGYEVGPVYRTKKVYQIEVTWVPGVSVPGGMNRFVIKDNDGDGTYEGGFTTPLFWPGLTVTMGGSYLMMQKFEHIEVTDENGLVIHGEYLEKQYFKIPGTPGKNDSQ